MKIKLLFVFVLFVYNAKSQKNISLLLDAETKQAVPFANICLESLDSGKSEYTTSNINGEFVNPCKSTARIAISFVGYKTLIDTIKPGETKVFSLQPDVFSLSQVVVTATRTEKHLKDVPVLTRVIPIEQIENQGFTSVNQVLANEIPGLDFKQVGFGTDINMQGLGAKNILILIDGEPLAGENGNNIDYSRLNTDNIERIEVVKGASSALYGSKAMAGVINIITKNPRKKLEIKLGGKYTAKNQVNYTNVKTYDSDYIYKSKLDLQNLNFNTNIGFNLNKISGQTDFAAKSFDAYQLKDKYEQIFDIINADTTIVIPAATTNINAYEDFRISQKLKFKTSKKIQFNFKASYYLHNKYDFYKDNKYQQFNDLSILGNILYKISDKSDIKASFSKDKYDKYLYFEKINEKKLNYTNTFLHPKIIFNTSLLKHKITIGTELFSEYLLSDKFKADKLMAKTVNTAVLFAQDDYNLTEFINITTGGRIDYHSRFKIHFSPKISLMYKFGNNRFRLNYATGFRSPTLKELYMDWNLLGIFTIKGSENLKPETNQYLSASVEYVKSKLNASVNIYSNWFKNKIDGQWYNNHKVYQYVNLGKTRISGIELMLKYHIIKHFNISSGYSYVSDNRSAENSMSTISPHTGNLRLEFYFRKKFYDFHLNLTGKYTGAKKYKTYDDIIYRGKEIKAWYNVYYDAYSIWNLSMSHNFYNRINIIIGINNIFDYQADIINFNTSINPGRRYFVSLQINIDKFFNNNLKISKNETN